jgi:peptidoglycan/xylan/chitin deacetylase (PgdA/CDA1 family)
MNLWVWGLTLAAAGISARWNWWRPRAGGVPVLMYHKIGTPPERSKLKKLWVSVSAFRRQMRYLADHGHRPVTFEQIAEWGAEGKPVPDNAVILTFDDGYENNHRYAFPVLKEFGYRGVFYLVVDAIGKDNFWHDPSSEARLPMLSWSQAEEMAAAGMEIGSHTLSHPRLSRLEPEKAKEQIFASRSAIESKLGRAPVSFAYPYGDGADEPRLQSDVREAGYRWAVSVHQGKADLDGNPYCLNRLFIRGDDSALDFHLQLTRGKSRF